MMTLKNLKLDLQKQSNKKKAKILQRFFKTGPGEYGEGDIFCGITVPVLRELSKKYQGLATRETLQLLKSKIHEQRLLSLFILILRYQKADLLEKEKIYKIYLKHSKYINNWDLIDLSAYHIVGSFLMDKNKAPIYRLAKSKSLWERRIAVLSTFCYIRNNKFNEMKNSADSFARQGRPDSKGSRLDAARNRKAGFGC